MIDDPTFRESIIHVSGLQLCSKETPTHVLSVSIVKVLKMPFLKNIYKRLLLVPRNLTASLNLS